MHIWLVRHAEAVTLDEAPTDAERRLSEEGRRQMGQLALWLLERERTPDLILHSPLRRAAETAQILREELGPQIRCEESHLLSPGMTCDLLLARLASEAAQTVVCVGHQPDVGRCLADMLGGGRYAVAPGAVACIAFSQIITAGGGQLQWFLDPKWF